ncbi:DNA-directed RNA polymerase, mitochondrial isoform X3 [Phymastichus coffea]|uniref:DNA-directed RNA polymerase, mitochondrial isoform X3 n=1 Tax=Phymastichus coffea TaxID=108790 RepID=UPI00273AAA1E|nr:DNA-directed RNA polymerase, mitochondrial isoform X3 [Phymastichus coffea]
MYRLLKLPGITIKNVCKSQGIQYAPRTCSYCNFCHYYYMLKSWQHLQARYQSTTINTVMLNSTTKRKLKRRVKKYAELVEVTDSITSNRKAAIQHLNATQLSILVDQPDITLDKLHKIKDEQLLRKNQMKNKCVVTSSDNSVDKIYDPAKDTNIIEQNHEMILDEENTKEESEILIEDLKSSGIIDEIALIKSSSLLNSMRDSGKIDTENALVSTREELTHFEEESIGKIIDEKKKAREALIYEERLIQFNKVLLGYISACVNSSNPEYALKALRSFAEKKRNKKKLLYINDVSLFNLFLEKLASKSDLKGILELLQFLREHNFKLNAQTYAYVYECIGRLDNDNQTKLNLSREIHEEMIKDGISFNDIITKSMFFHDQRVFVEDVIKLLGNQFKPTYSTPDTRYDCRLLERLNEEETTPSSTVEGLLKLSDLEDRLKKQIKAEIDGELVVKNISKQKVTSHSVKFYRNTLCSIEKHWEKVAFSAFKRHFEALRNREKFRKSTKLVLFPYLAVLKPEDYVSIIMREIKKLGMGSEMYSLPFYSLCRVIGSQVFKMYEAKMKEKNGTNEKTSEVYIAYCDWFLSRKDKLNGRVKWTLLEHEANKYGVTIGAAVPTWPNYVHLSVGKFLYNIIFNDIKIDSNILKQNKSNAHAKHVSAFFKIFRHCGISLKEEVKPHPLVAKLYRESQPETLAFDTTLVPCLCPPRPWINIRSGGYIVTDTEIIRVNHTGAQQWELLRKTPVNKLFPALDSLNQLGSIPWAINSPILDVAIKVFQDNGSSKLNMPQPPSVLKAILPAPKCASSAEKRQIDKARIELKRRKNEMYSLWCDALYRLSLANHFRNDIFWLPHNMDFRGRVYPVPPHLNHLGSDLARSMLVFALKKPLGPKGLDWLKLHAINLTGFKKRDPISERLRYADEIMDKILDSAEKPLSGAMWWSTSEEPWQTLAACMEIAAALKSPDPEKYETGFPIHQDGSCNGLQHYAALGRDEIGAKSVNLYPYDSPQDVYSSVAAMVDDMRRKDAAEGNQVAKILDGFIRRKVIKQTVMTTVYGVTWFGAKLQIARQLKDMPDFPQEHLWPASIYLVQKTFQTLRTMFKSAREIQDWFTECARLVCASREQNMEWVTPLGLPVVQPYSKFCQPPTNQTIYTYFSPDSYRKPNMMKQKNAFAPNFVHSLDSSHMMLTSIHCERAGIMYVSVHDCYWTHPCSVEIMNKICREQFVALHSEPILEDLSRFLINKFSFDQLLQNLRKLKLNETLARVPRQGDFNLEKVLDSIYFFS